MPKVLVFMPDGFEEIEAVTLVDILRRADITVQTLSLNDDTSCLGAHKINVQADLVFDNLDASRFDMVLLPGGLPGSLHLRDDKRVLQLLQDFDAQKKYIGAICAAPWALDAAGVLKNAYTCYPSCEEQMSAKGYVDDRDVVVDENIITSRGPSTAMSFALEIVRLLRGEKVYEDLKNALLLG